ncbi:PPE domain-containing protein [Nocardia sp. NBC_00565]|uniref:PPE domain-containing protein n=1 Tax=Nocardia sp. NBC_00565 TaxID=2975993 RepID=UPI002E801A25|nr:PPE domain-containing protein [Nocardia sp. NBC_00565]WUC07684.1 PPE domain-containing protein [Nocardia sp. NBC_00565]
MALNVDPGELARAAAALAELARGTGAALPKGWVVPAGTDLTSAHRVPQLNADLADLSNGMLGLLNEVQRTAHHIGAAAVDYSTADDEGARVINGSGADLATNPVGEVQPFSARQLPDFSLPTPGGSVDPLDFAYQLRTGPGPGPAAEFANSVRKFLTDSHTTATSGLDQAALTMQNWTPVGSAAADKLAQHRGWLDQLGTGLGNLADGIDAYHNAFRDVKAKHPTPEEIIAARKELIQAMRSKNQLAITKALAKFQEQNARSLEAITGYTTAVNSKPGTGTGSGSDDDSGSDSGSGSGSGSGDSGDSSALTQMLPALMSALASGATGLSSANSDSGEDLEVDPGMLEDVGGYGYSGGGGVGGGGGGGAIPISAVENVASGRSVQVGAMPVVATAGTAASALPRTSVIEPLQTSSAAARGASATGSSPYMPMMPMSPGAGGGAGAGGDRSRVVAWHPDRLMYVDDTPHTEAVIGERPSIAPTVTSPTPSQHQAPTNSGGTA